MKSRYFQLFFLSRAKALASGQLNGLLLSCGRSFLQFGWLGGICFELCIGIMDFLFQKPGLLKNGVEEYDG